MNHLLPELLSIGSCPGDNGQIPGSTGYCGIRLSETTDLRTYSKAWSKLGARRKVVVTINVTSGPEIQSSVKKDL